MTKKFKYLNFLCLLMLIPTLFPPLTLHAASPTVSLTVDGVPYRSYTSLQEALNMVEPLSGTDFLIEIASGVVSDPSYIVQEQGKNLTIRPMPGANVTITNTIHVDGNALYSDSAGVMLQDLYFDFSAASSPSNCIFLTNAAGARSYVHNFVVSACSFKGIYGTTVALQSVAGGIRNISMIDCIGEDLHSPAQLRALAGTGWIENCNFTHTLEGINIYGPGNLDISNFYLKATTYAVRVGQAAGDVTTSGALTINNSILESASLTDGTLILRNNVPESVNIIHSNITNTATPSTAIQNTNAQIASSFIINIVESNIVGNITNIAVNSIRIIDSPNVPNGPVSVLPQPTNWWLLLLLFIPLGIIAGLLVFVLVSNILHIIICLSTGRPCRRRQGCPKKCKSPGCTR